ncbi:hypothetical protein [Halomonas sp.]|uniref:hypothetical protein n=1 Tax=Halomonas sp. TaxID=1486246 RepID=UPI003F8DAFBC
MTKKKSEDILDNAFRLYHQGYSPELIELPESAVFPSLIPAAPSTARKSRVTGLLLGEPAPRFVRRGRNVRYRLSDVLAWLSEVDPQRSTAEAFMAKQSLEASLNLSSE